MSFNKIQRDDGATIFEDGDGESSLVMLNGISRTFTIKSLVTAISPTVVDLTLEAVESDGVTRKSADVWVSYSYKGNTTSTIELFSSVFTATFVSTPANRISELITGRSGFIVINSGESVVIRITKLSGVNSIVLLEPSGESQLISLP